MTIENEKSPSRRKDDVRPAVALDWEKPAAEVIEAPTNTPGTEWTILLTSVGHGLVHERGVPFSEVKMHHRVVNVVDEAVVIELRKRVAELEAARIAYASEFPLTTDGEPDVGNIHANIRELKARVAAQPVAASATGLEGLKKHWLRPLGSEKDEHYVKFSDVERLLATQSAKQGAPAETSKPTDLSHRLRETADQQPGWKSLLMAAAEEIERYYGGMLAWKQTAEKKDRDWAAERTARIDERCAARAAAQVPPDAAHLTGQEMFEIAAPYFAWNAESWHKATQGNIGMPALLNYTRAVIDAALAKQSGAHAAADDAKGGAV